LWSIRRSWRDQGDLNAKENENGIPGNIKSKGMAIDSKSKSTAGAYKFTQGQMKRLKEELRILQRTTPIKYLIIVAPEFDKSDIDLTWKEFRKEEIFLICFASVFIQKWSESIISGSSKLSHNF
jgi:hypothetical protein